MMPRRAQPTEAFTVERSRARGYRGAATSRNRLFCCSREWHSTSGAALSGGEQRFYMSQELRLDRKKEHRNKECDRE